MERPGLIELAVYALLLTGAAGWVYALPPFTHEPGDRMQVADIQPVSTSGEVRGTEPGGETASMSRAIGEPPVTQTQTTEQAAEANPDDEPASQHNLLVVTARSLNMRSEPNAGSALVGNYPRGARVERMDKNGNWILVRTEDGVTGWMYTAYLDTAPN